jgi:hypothetical protein
MSPSRKTILNDQVEIYFENAHVTLYFNPNLHAVGTWFRPAALGAGWNGTETIKLALEKGLELIKEKRATRWIADTREMPVMPPDAQQWCTEDWWPRALSAGFRWLAILLPGSILAKLAIDEAIQASMEHAESETRYFGTVEGAKEWLCSKP